jgi:tRNA threonylcarbamoyladenosine biosynthesis protein TsaB
MSVLGIETATMVCAAAVSSGARVIAEAWVEERNVHAERLLSLIDDVLRKTRISPEQLDAIAVSIGPGSFTGLRIGLSVAKGLAYATGRPLVAVPTLEALARKAAEPGVAHPLILPLLDARRDEVYGQFFVASDRGVTGLGEPHDRSLKEVAEEIRGRHVLVTGEASGTFRAFVESGYPELRKVVQFSEESVARCSGGTVAVMGEEMLARGMTEDASVLEPRYIKEFFFKTRQ